MRIGRNEPGHAGLVLLGFPIRIRPGFGVFLVLLAVLYPWPLGLFVSGAVAIFTVIHELGHAVSARRAGCRASISLDFMVAYASYEPVRPLTWSQRAVIAASGPALQVATGMVALLVLGVNPFSFDSVASSDLAAAVWWAGVALGLLNLVPLMPLDGGAIVASVVEHLWPGGGRRFFVWMSLVVTSTVAAMLLMVGAVGLLPLVVFMLFVQWQQTRIVEQPLAFLDLAERRFMESPSFLAAVECALLALDGGDDQLAVRWLHTAERVALGNEVREAVSAEPRLASLRGAPGASAEWFADL